MLRTVLFLVAVLIIWHSGRWVYAQVPEVFPRADHLVFALWVCGCTLALFFVPFFRGRLRKLEGWKDVARKTGAGAAAYAVPAVVGVVVAGFAGWAMLTFQASPGELAVKVAALTALVLLAEALPEELIFRGYIFSELSASFGAWVTVLLQAVIFTIFALLIGAAPTLLDASFIFTFGMVLGVLRSVSGSLWMAVGFHLAFMLAVQALGGGWNIMASDQPEMMRMMILTMLPFSVVIAVLAGRVGTVRPAAEISG